MDVSTKGKSDKKSIIAIALLIILIGGTIGYIFYNEWSYYKSSDPDYVNYIEYNALYPITLNLSAISTELEANNISISLTDRIECNYGPTFNNVTIPDTKCLIFSTGNPSYNDAWVVIRLYEADEVASIFNKVDMDDYKPDLEQSMSYITNIILNATGAEPNSYFWFYEDGADLDYPDSLILLPEPLERVQSFFRIDGSDP